VRVKIRGRKVWGGGYAPYWRWHVTLEDPEADEVVHVGNWVVWEEALRNGILAWRFANMRWRTIAGPGATSELEIVR
jgi:hypothetical protein